MAVDSKQGVNAGNGFPTAGPTNGAVTNGTRRRKRPSSLMEAATSLPSVETSLDEFIARANSTLVDADKWRAVEQQAREEDEKRREADSLRWKAAEQQLREGGIREQSLRSQLDGLQGKLAEAEARAAVASSGSGQVGVIADLKVRLSNMEEKARDAEQRVTSLAEELEVARSKAVEMPPLPSGPTLSPCMSCPA